MRYQLLGLYTKAHISSQSMEINYFTAPSDSGSPLSINNAADLKASTTAIQNTLPSAPAHDGILVACYSVHPLVERFANHLPTTGIFEASLVATLPLLRSGGGWGIVTTGPFWEDHLSQGVKEFLGGESERFWGVFSTGLNAGDFHGDEITPEMVRARLAEATRRLLKRGRVDVVVMGCAGMVGLEGIIGGVLKEEYGEKRAGEVYIMDGVRAGVGVLGQMVNHRRMFLAKS